MTIETREISRPETVGSEKESELIKLWQSGTRYYRVELTQDLFGDNVLVLRWGGLNSKRGGEKTLIVESWEKGLERIEAIGKRRTQRGYRLVS